MELPPNPTVLVLLVVTDGAEWLPDVLRGLRQQEHKPLKILAVDNASTDGSAQILLKAFGARRVITLERRVGYGRALAAGLKVAAERALDADAFLLLHDDAALQKGAVTAMLRALSRDGVGIAGAKLLEWNDPSFLQDIGHTTDRYGRAVPRVERGEIDQGQHDGIHDVLYVTSAAMLVAREVVERVGLFDLRYVSLRDDLDLCWRARLAGYGTVVTTEAAARHAQAGVRELRHAPPRRRVRYFAERNMLATLIKNYSLPRLLLALPVTLAIALGNALLFLATGRRRTAAQVLEAVQWNVVHLPSTLRARVRAQRARKVSDAAVTGLMHHGATRLRAQLERAVETVVGQVEEQEDGDSAPPTIVARIRAHPAAAITLAVAIVAFLGARTLLFPGHLAGADFAPFPRDAASFFSEYASGWRGAGGGGAAPATPGLVVLGLLTFLSFGSGWLAERVLFGALAIVAAGTMYRLAGALGLRAGPRRLACLLYVATPLVLGAVGEGRLQELVLAAAAPGLLLPLLRAAGIAPDAGWRSTAAGAAALAVAASLSPWSLPFVAGSAVIVAVLCGPGRSASNARSRAAVRRIARASRNVLACGAAMVGIALLLLLPWSVELFRARSPLGWGGDARGGGIIDLLALSPGTLRPLPLALCAGFLLAAVAGTVAALPARRYASGLLGSLGAVSLFVAWMVARGVPWIAPRPALPLTVLAVVVVILAAFAFEAVIDRLRERLFGIVHVAAALVGVLLLGQLVVAGAWIARGRFPGLVESGALVPSFLTREAQRGGEFRVVWLDGSSEAPVFDLTGPEGRSMRSYLTRPDGAGARALRSAVGAVLGRSSESGGRLLATIGVRYVIVRPGADASLSEVVARQVDLAFSQRFRGGTVYINENALPVAAGIRTASWRAAAESSSIASAASAGPVSAGPALRRTGSARYEGRTAAVPRRSAARARRQNPREVVFLAEDYHPSWRAVIGTTEVRPRPSFGWAARFVGPRPAAAGAQPVLLRWDGQRFHRFALLGQLLVAIVFAAAWSQRAARERGER